MQVTLKGPSGLASDVYVGDGDVTTSTGLVVTAGDVVSLQLPQGCKVYGVAAAAATVHVIRLGG